MEGTNKLLLRMPNRLCAPELGADDMDDAAWEKLPRNWPDCLNTAVKCLNYRILPALKFSPKELLLGQVVNTPTKPIAIAQETVTAGDAARHVLYVAQQRLDGYNEAVQHAEKRKQAFNRKVHGSRAGPVTFSVNSLVQVYRSDLDYTFSTERKLLPKWSQPHRVVKQLENSYQLQTLAGAPIAGKFHARRLRQFHPRPGTELALKEAQRLRSEISSQP